MQKTKRALIILVVILVAVTALALIIALYNSSQERRSAEEEEDETPYLGNVSEPVYIAFNGGGGEDVLEFTLEDGVWYYSAEKEFPLTQDYLTKIAEMIPGFKAVRKLGISENLSYYGLADPTYTLTVKDADGNTLSLLIGGKIKDDRYYVMEPGGDVVYTIEKELPDSLQYSLYKMAEIETFDTFTEENLVSLSFDRNGYSSYFEKDTDTDSEGNETYIWYCLKDGERIKASDYTFTDKDGKTATAKTYIDAILKNFTNNFFFGCKDYNCTDEEMKEYGFDTPLTVKAVYTATNDEKETEERTLVFLFGNEFSETGEYGEESYYYAMLEGSKAVNSMTARRITPFIDALGALGIINAVG